MPADDKRDRPEPYERLVLDLWETGARESASPSAPDTGSAAVGAGVDEELDGVAAHLTALDPNGRRFGRVIRDALDAALDGGRTGRFRIEDLHKVEKTFVGMRVELKLAREFEFEDGAFMDFSIAGVDVDAKFSLFRRGWQIPPEALDHLCLLIWCSDRESAFDVGLIRARREYLNVGANRDRKVSLNAQGVAHVRRLLHHAPLPPNLLLQLPAEVIDGITAIRGPRTGQPRVNALFRLVQQRLVPRAAVETVAQQTDPAKRARDARLPRNLGREGILVLGGDYTVYKETARAFGLPVPTASEWISVRVARVDEASPRSKVLLQGSWWAIAEDGDPVEPAPLIDTRRPSD